MVDARRAASATIGPVSPEGSAAPPASKSTALASRSSSAGSRSSMNRATCASDGARPIGQRPQTTAATDSRTASTPSAASIAGARDVQSAKNSATASTAAAASAARTIARKSETRRHRALTRSSSSRICADCDCIFLSLVPSP